MPASGRRRTLAAGLVVLAVAMVLAPAAAAASTASDTQLNGRVMVVHRGAHAHSVTVSAPAAGEVLLGLTAAASDADWSTAGAESAVVSIWVDGRYASDLVIPSAVPTPRKLALGHLDAGRHRVSFAFAADRSPAGAHSAVLQDLRLELVAPEDAAYTAMRGSG